MLMLPTPTAFSTANGGETGWFRFGHVTDPVSIVVSIGKGGKRVDAYVDFESASRSFSRSYLDVR